ncbi:MAG: type II toxin-antitoxin system death-on-curing family toxin [Pyrinomonadaceae bacterium]
MSFLFLTKEEVIQIQARLIDEFGGTHGLRDEGALESALKVAGNREYYENADLATCSATYAYHLTKAHAFIDGNKRIAAAVAEIFLEINGAQLNTTNEKIIKLFLNIADGKITREAVEQVFRQRVAGLHIVDSNPEIE